MTALDCGNCGSGETAHTGGRCPGSCDHDGCPDERYEPVGGER